MTSADTAPLLEVRDLRVEFRTGQRIVNAVNGVDFEVSRGETLAILGESGSGKSVSLEAVLGVLESPPGFVTGGTATFQGQDLFAMPPRRQRQAKLDFASSKAADAATAVNKKRTRSPSKDDAIDLTKPQKKEPTLDTQPRSSPNATPSKSLKSSKAPIADSAKLSPVADADVTAVFEHHAGDEPYTLLHWTTASRVT